MKRAFPLVSLLVLLPLTVAAHHGLDANTLGIAQPVSLLGLQTEGGEFRLAAGSGRYLTTALRMDYAPATIFSFGLRIPFQILEVSGAGTRRGLGDITATAKIALVTLPDGVVTLGLAATLPTGSPELGLGNGHVELNPYLRANLVFDTFLVQASFGDSISLSGGPWDDAPDFIDPHSNHELRYQLGLGVSLFRQLQLVAVANGVTVLEASRRGETLFTAGPQARWSPVPAWQIYGGAQLPIYGDHRAEWRANVGVQTLF